MNKKFLLAFVLTVCWITLELTSCFAEQKPAFESERQALLNDGMHMGYRQNKQDFFQEGETLFEQQEFSKSIEKYTKAINEDNTFMEAYFKRGEAYFELKNYEAANEDYTMVLKNTSTYRKANFKRAICYYYQANYQKAIDDTEIVLCSQPDHAGSYLVQAVCLQKLGLKEKAIETYKTLLKNVPNSEKDVINIANKMLQKLENESIK